MLIEGHDSISDMFNVFHDGAIAHYEKVESDTLLTVDIEYLAQRVKPSYRIFNIRLIGLGEVEFKPWPSDLLVSEMQVIRDIATIFQPDLEILDAGVDRGRVQLFCTQHAQAFDFCGGELHFHARAAVVTDESTKTYSMEELKLLCKGYWDEWSEKSGRSGH